jgi:catabolite regulation protein CreA
MNRLFAIKKSTVEFSYNSVHSYNSVEHVLRALALDHAYCENPDQPNFPPTLLPKVEPVADSCHDSQETASVEQETDYSLNISEISSSYLKPSASLPQNTEKEEVDDPEFMIDKSEHSYDSSVKIPLPSACLSQTIEHLLPKEEVEDPEFTVVQSENSYESSVRIPSPNACLSQNTEMLVSKEEVDDPEYSGVQSEISYESSGKISSPNACLSQNTEMLVPKEEIDDPEYSGVQSEISYESSGKISSPSSSFSQTAERSVSKSEVDEPKYIVSSSCLDSLFKMIVCQICGSPFDLENVWKHVDGSALEVFLTCVNNHSYSWKSQL